MAQNIPFLLRMTSYYICSMLYSTISFAMKEPSQTGSGLVFTGEFWFEGTQFFTQDSVGCDVGNPIGIYEVELLENGNLKFTVIEDECATRANGMQGATVAAVWEPVP